MIDRMKPWFVPSLIAAGFIAVVVGYTSSAAIIFEAARAAGASPAEIASWLWALGLGMGVTCVGLSLVYRSPVLTAWSTPGAALLATSLAGVPMSEAIGAFLFASALIAIAGFSGAFDRVMRHVPHAVASAMLAGVLVRFGLDVFAVLPANAALVGSMLVTFVLGRRLLPRYAIPVTLLAGVVVSAAAGQLHSAAFTIEWAHPVFTLPRWTMSSLIGIGLPLFIVTMASQNAPGLAVLRANGYRVPVSPLVGFTGLTGVLLAPFGGFSFNLAAITAAICMSPDAHPDPTQRYRASVWAGVFYLITGLFGATVAGALTAFPQALVTAIAGLALLATIANSLHGALAEPQDRDAALITFLVTASGLTLFGIGGAFWGLLFGLAVSIVGRRRAA